MATKRALADDHHRAFTRQPEQLTAEEKDTVRRLAEDVPALWRAQSTTSRDRQTIARIMLDRVVIRVFGETERAEGATARQIADDLNAKGWRPAKKPMFDALIVQKLLVRKGLGKKRPIWLATFPVATTMR